MEVMTRLVARGKVTPEKSAAILQQVLSPGALQDLRGVAMAERVCLRCGGERSRAWRRLVGRMRKRRQPAWRCSEAQPCGAWCSAAAAQPGPGRKGCRESAPGRRSCLCRM